MHYYLLISISAPTSKQLSPSLPSTPEKDILTSTTTINDPRQQAKNQSDFAIKTPFSDIDLEAAYHGIIQDKGGKKWSKQDIPFGIDDIKDLVRLFTSPKSSSFVNPVFFTTNPNYLSLSAFL